MPIQVTKPGTIVMGLGFATLKPVKGTAAMTVADVDGVTIAGLLFDAGETESPVLLEVGRRGQQGAATARTPHFLPTSSSASAAQASARRRSRSPSTPATSSSTTHGYGAPTTAPASAGRATPARTDGRRTATMSPRMASSSSTTSSTRCCGRATADEPTSTSPRSPTIRPTRPSTPAAPNVNGWASYKVADNVTSHEAWGLGVYSVFRHPDVVLTRAIEVPKTPGVQFHHMITVALGNLWLDRQRHQQHRRRHRR